MPGRPARYASTGGRLVEDSAAAALAGLLAAGDCVTSAAAVLLAAAAGALLVPDRAGRLRRLRPPVPRASRPTTWLGLRVATVTATIPWRWSPARS